MRATEIAAMIGQWAAFALGFIGLFGSPMLIFIAIFVYLAASSEAHMVALRSLSQGLPVGASYLSAASQLNRDVLLKQSQGLFQIAQSEVVERDQSDPVAPAGHAS